VTTDLRREMTVERARFTDLPGLRRFVADACGDARADAEERDALELAVDEACTNIVEHGYPLDDPGPVALAFECDANELRVSIADHGTPFDPEQAPPVDTASRWSQRVPGGLGWHLIRSVVDTLRYDTGTDGTNRLTLIKRRRPD
jgi:serine/threonine-protein kinase RsbW